MRFHNRRKIAYFSALTILLSYAELLLPRPIPFLKFGLGNIVVLSALDFPPGDFLALLFLKSAASGFVTGTLLSPFFIVSLFQTLLSGLLMYALKRISPRLISVYGISVAGAGLSAFAQILMISLYLGKETISLLWIMLLFAIVSGLVTAAISKKLELSSHAPEILQDCLKNNTKSGGKSYFLSIFFIIFSVFLVFLTKKTAFLLAMLLLSLFFQRLLGRRISLLPHLYLWIFILILNLFGGSGEVLLRLGGLALYKDSLLLGLKKALRLSTAVAISQSAASLSFSSDGLLSLTISYYSALLEDFRRQRGGLFERISATLSKKSFEIENANPEKQGGQPLLFALQLLLFAALFLADFYAFKVK